MIDGANSMLMPQLRLNFYFIRPMPNYQDKFTFDVNDIDLIEQALRTEMANELDRGGQTPQYASTPKERKIGELLGKIHNQKIFYSSVAKSNVPLG